MDKNLKNNFILILFYNIKMNFDEKPEQKYLCNQERPLYPYIERNYNIHIPLYHIVNDERPMDIFDNSNYRSFTMMSYTLFDSNLKNLMLGYFESNEPKIDTNFFERNQKFLEGLPIKEKYMLSGYTFNGDVFVNLYLSGKTISEKQQELESYIMNYSPGPAYASFGTKQYSIIPIYFQLIERLKLKKKFKGISYDNTPNNELIKQNKESIDFFVQMYGEVGPSITDDLNDYLDWTRLIEEKKRLESGDNSVKEDVMFSIEFYEDDMGEDTLANQETIREWFGDIKRDEYYLELMKECIKEYYEDLEKIFNKAPELEKEMEVFRGVKTMYYKKDNSDMYINNTFTSTSLDPIKAISFSAPENQCCLKKITLKPGFKLICMEPITQVRGEFELLIPPNNKFRIINHQELKPKTWSRQKFEHIKSYDNFYNYVCKNETIEIQPGTNKKYINVYKSPMTLTIMESS